MTLLVFGKTGQVARELLQIGGVVSLGREAADLSNPGLCADAIRAHAPRAVINAAAYTAVDRAEEEEALAETINAAAPGAMARACAAMGIPLVHISTDYVFAGTGNSPWKTDDATDPQNAYGRTKLAGEEAIRGSGADHAILRTSWVFSAHGENFVKTMLRLSETREGLSVVADQIGGPTPAGAIAASCLAIADQLVDDPTKSGTYHYAGAPDVSWHDFAAGIFARAGRTMTLTPIPTSSYPTQAARPLNSRMDCLSTAEVFGLTRPDWQAALDDVLKDLEITR